MKWQLCPWLTDEGYSGYLDLSSRYRTLRLRLILRRRPSSPPPPSPTPAGGAARRRPLRASEADKASQGHSTSSHDVRPQAALRVAIRRRRRRTEPAEEDTPVLVPRPRRRRTRWRRDSSWEDQCCWPPPPTNPKIWPASKAPGSSLSAMSKSFKLLGINP